MTQKIHHPLSLDAIFAHISRPFLTQLHFPFLTPSLPYIYLHYVFLPMLSRSRTDDKNTFDWYNGLLKNSSTGLPTS